MLILRSFINSFVWMVLLTYQYWNVYEILFNSRFDEKLMWTKRKPRLCRLWSHMRKEVLASGHLVFNKAGFFNFFRFMFLIVTNFRSPQSPNKKSQKVVFLKSYFQKVAFHDELPENLDAVCFLFFLNEYQQLSFSLWLSAGWFLLAL